MTATRTTLAGATIGLVSAAAQSLRPSLTPRSTLHQGLVTGVMATTGVIAGAGAGWIGGRLAGGRINGYWPAALAVGGCAGVAAVVGHRFARAQDAEHTEWGPQDSHLILGAEAGAVSAAGFTLAGVLVARETHDAGAALARRFGGRQGVWTAAVATTGMQAVGGLFVLLLRRVLARLAADGRAADVALAQPTMDPHVSGGPGSAVDYDSLSREGRRFVAWRVTAADIEDAGLPLVGEPVRAYVGVDTAETVSARVDLALAELERLGAFERSAILAVSPAGSGYANSVPVEALELLTGGDCAAVTVQYGVLPSMWSRDKLPLAAETFRLLIDRIHERNAQLPEGGRPKLLLFGESLGAQAAQLGLCEEPSLVDFVDARLAKVSAALFVGTPGGQSLRDDLLHHAGTVHADRWQSVPTPWPAGVQLWFLEHDADPVTRFRRDLMYRRPDWLSGERGRNVPASMRWSPLATWQQVGLDVAYATQAQSGVFRSLGHDYRADLPHLVAAAFAPEAADLVPRVQELLADREVTRDRRLAAAEGEEEPHPSDVAGPVLPAAAGEMGAAGDAPVG